MEHVYECLDRGVEVGPIAHLVANPATDIATVCGKLLTWCEDENGDRIEPAPASCFHFDHGFSSESGCDGCGTIAKTYEDA